MSLLLTSKCLLHSHTRIPPAALHWNVVYKRTLKWRLHTLKWLTVRFLVHPHIKSSVSSHWNVFYTEIHSAFSQWNVFYIFTLKYLVCHHICTEMSYASLQWNLFSDNEISSLFWQWNVFYVHIMKWHVSSDWNVFYYITLKCLLAVHTYMSHKCLLHSHTKCLL